MDAAIYTPIGGGRISKADAFDVLAEKLNIEERPISEIRRDVFRLVFSLGRLAVEQGQEGKIDLEIFPESWDVLGAIYEGLAQIEAQSMEPTHQANLTTFLAERSAAAA